MVGSRHRSAAVVRGRDEERAGVAAANPHYAHDGMGRMIWRRRRPPAATRTMAMPRAGARGQGLLSCHPQATIEAFVLRAEGGTQGD